MNEHKIAWLKSMGFEDNGSIIDCDITAETITFQTDDGPVTRQKTSVWTRVMGYHRPTTSFNPGKQSEHEERVCFEERQAGRLLT